MKFLIFSIAFIFSISIFSCSSPENSQFTRVDSLHSVLQSIEDTLAQISLAKVNRLVDENQTLIERVEKEYGDTLTKDQMFFFYDFKRYRKSLTQLVTNIEFQVGQVAYTKTQLENLKEDLKNGLLTQEQFNAYFSSEKDAVQRLKEGSISLSNWYRGTFGRYNELKTGVEAIFENE